MHYHVLYHFTMNQVTTRLAGRSLLRPSLATRRTFATSTPGGTPLTRAQYIGMFLFGGGVIGATYQEQQTCKILHIKRSPTEFFDLQRRPTGSLDKNDYLHRRPTGEP